MHPYRRALSSAFRVFCALLPVLLTGSWAVRPGMAQDAIEPDIITLWPEGAPGAVGEEPEDIPTLAIYLPKASAASGAAAGVPAELHIYRSGPHGVGLAPDDPALSTWPDRLEDWLRVQGAPGE